jgi:hypothetical protein
MSNQRRQAILASMAVLLALALTLFLIDRGVANDLQPPRDPVGMARWIANHPADWLTASAISDSALDTSLPRRIELWHASYALGNRLAPRLRNPRAAFVRGGLFHWYELDDRNRKAVLDIAAPLLRDPQMFGSLHESLYDLTRDFDYLARNAPQTVDATGWLRGLAANRGLFAEYRQMRARYEQLRLANFASARATLPAYELPSLLPRRLTTAEEPLVRLILEEMNRQSFDPTRVKGEIEPMIEYAIAHRLQPLAGLSPFVELAGPLPDVTRARLALALGRADAATLIELGSSTAGTPAWAPYHLERTEYEARMGNDAAAAKLRQQLAGAARSPVQWSDTCSANELCDVARASVYSSGKVELRADATQTDQIPPYLEIYADDARVAEGEIGDESRFLLALPPGVHRIEVRLVNPRMANGTQRRVRLS